LISKAHAGKPCPETFSLRDSPQRFDYLNPSPRRDSARG